MSMLTTELVRTIPSIDDDEDFCTNEACQDIQKYRGKPPLSRSSSTRSVLTTEHDDSEASLEDDENHSVSTSQKFSRRVSSDSIGSLHAESLAVDLVPVSTSSQMKIIDVDEESIGSLQSERLDDSDSAVGVQASEEDSKKAVASSFRGASVANTEEFELSKEARNEALHRMGLTAVYTSPFSAEDELELIPFLRTFDIEQLEDEIEKRLREHAQLRARFEELVPHKISFETFFKRHFFRCDPDRIQRLWEESEQRRLVPLPFQAFQSFAKLSGTVFEDLFSIQTVTKDDDEVQTPKPQKDKYQIKNSTKEK